MNDDSIEALFAGESDLGQLPIGMAAAIRDFHASKTAPDAEPVTYGRMEDCQQAPERETIASVTRILVWDHRVSVVGHSPNRAACVAISAAVQTAAAIARAQGYVERVNLTEDSPGVPVYEVVLTEREESRQIVAGLMASFAGIARTTEGDQHGSVMLLSDMRKNIPERIAFAQT